MAGSITKLVWRIADGDESAADDLFERVQKRLAYHASVLVHRKAFFLADPNEIAQQAFEKIVVWINENGFPASAGRNHFFGMLELSTFEVAATSAAAQSNGIRRYVEMLGSVDTNRSEASRAELHSNFVDQLETSDSIDDRSKSIAILLMQGYSISEIANLFAMPLRSVQRRILKTKTNLQLQIEKPK